MTALYLYDDAIARGFEPFALTRPVSELRAGVELIRRRWENRLGALARGFLAGVHLADFEELHAPPAICGDADLETGAIVASSRCVAALGAQAPERGSRAWVCGGRIAAVRIGAGVSASLFADGKLTLDELAARVHAAGRGPVSAAPATQPFTPVSGAGVVEISGRWIDAPWDLIADLPAQLDEDVRALASALTIHNPRGLEIIGKHEVYCERDATIEPQVVFDTRAGPVLVRRGSTISAFTRLVGPCYVGEDSIVLGDQVGACAIGEVSKVRGEISNSIVLGHSNKAHAGFLGHSYLGRWVNLGAGTTTSNLKNTYGSVHVQTAEGAVDTGLQLLGTLFGDHAKTAIGTMLTTGTIVGAGASVFGSLSPPKRVPPFAWGCAAPAERYDAEKFLQVAERMMARRHVALGEKARRALRAAYEAAMSYEL